MSKTRVNPYPSGQPAHRWLVKEVAKRSDADSLSWQVIFDGCHARDGIPANKPVTVLSEVESVEGCTLRLVRNDSNRHLSPILYVAWFRIIQDYDEPFTVNDYSVQGGHEDSDSWLEWIEANMDQHDTYCDSREWYSG